MLITQLIKVLGLTLASFIVAFAITPLVSKILYRLQAKKQIRSSESAPIFSNLHKKKEGTPTMGGVIIWATVLGIAVFLWVMSLLFGGFWTTLNFVDRAQTYLPITAMFFAAMIGFFDDVFGILKIGPHGGGLKMSQKIFGYLVIAIIGAWWFYFRLDWHSLSVPFYGVIEIGRWYIPLFIFIITASAFSANETDGLDGLAGGVMLFAFTSLTVVAFALGRYELATFSGAIVGALLAFLWFNIYPARFFMGDTGSMSLGITLGVISMLTNTTLLLPLFASILVLESISVIIQVLSKKIRGKKVFLSAPIHHHFEAIGWPETQVTMRFWIISVIFATLGLVVFFLSR